jgi:hypothetical protein
MNKRSLSNHKKTARTESLMASKTCQNSHLVAVTKGREWIFS